MPANEGDATRDLLVRPPAPVLRLRPTVPSEVINPRQRAQERDGPYITHPSLIDEASRFRTGSYAPDITMGQYRELWRTEVDELREQPADFQIHSLMFIHPAADMQKVQGWTDEQIAAAVERTYVGAQRYLYPGALMPSSLVDRFGVTADVAYWNSSGEESRRARARVFLKHVLDNERWKKAEYVWEADAWSDVFGLMRDDLMIIANKHKYNTIGKETYLALYLLTGKTKLLVYKLDRSTIADWDLDYDRLQALLVYRYYAFPFAVYEAKGWDGDPREARRQACSAGAVYLDMLERLSRHPGKIGDTKSDAFQTAESRNTQAFFVFTSFGAHWHILVGYKRPRLKREYAGQEGMSESVYVFQRIWSARAVTERKAWELLSLVDQIHLWGVAHHRDFVIRHLKPWHEFARRCYAHDAAWVLESVEGAGSSTDPKTGKRLWRIPTGCTRLPEWTQHLTGDFSARQKHLGERAGFHMTEACQRHQSEARVRAGSPSDGDFNCVLGEGCGTIADPGYPLGCWEELVLHLREIHNKDDAYIAALQDTWTRGKVFERKGSLTLK
ncbi:hypothetical protein C8A01DRAFT_47917 [Parachaetomium inaequale]|uniref:Uncharacterized protein n=1 Tax=Parachaetomium inaequale TaxID=2588326 RepID=A0AAN6PCP4_9PEZI|nr:hypothetical protein C8A01DRAFT_47917 [Parachaetomium inaequale]